MFLFRSQYLLDFVLLFISMLYHMYTWYSANDDSVFRGNQNYLVYFPLGSSSSCY